MTESGYIHVLITFSSFFVYLLNQGLYLLVFNAVIEHKLDNMNITVDEERIKAK